MVLSSSQHLLLALSLALCAYFLLPRMFGGGVRGNGKQEPRRMPAAMHGRENQRSHQSPRRILEKGNHLDQIKSEMENQLKTEKTGTGRSMAFTLMPIYAVGVALFAAYKFSKIKSNEKSRLKSSKDDEKKTKETENQLLELERHLSHTEKMLNSLLTQLDPLSNSVNSLATEQKDEIMYQLQSIRQLMKKSGMDKSSFSNSVNQACEDTLEHLIHSFKSQNPRIFAENDVPKLNVEDLDSPAHNPIAEEQAFQSGASHCKEDGSPLDELDVASRQTFDGLRKRKVKD